MIARFHYDERTLDRLLHDRLSEDEREVSSHVEACEVCQKQIDDLSRKGLSWDDVGDLLSNVDRQPVDVGNRKLEAYATFLQPTEHPESLGRFARFEIMEFLGRGGMGVVMRGYDTSLDRHCAVKILSPELATSASARKRFSREAKSAAAVVHPHVVPIQTVDEYNGLPYLVMPVVEGQSLEARVGDSGPLQVVEVIRIASQVADGLAAAHAQGLVHRDIKPANILLENGIERVQITDFGLARAIDDASMTRSGVIAGTPQYMSPEQAHGDTIDHRSDLFSLGSVMYFMLTGRSPFRAETTMGVLNRIGNDQPRRLQTIDSSVPAWLEGIVMKLLSKSPDDRFESAAEVAELLEDCLAHVQQPTSTPLPDTVAKLVKSFGSDETNSAESLGNFRYPPIGKLVATAAFAFSLIFAGVLIVLELNKGTLTIESDVDDIPIRIMQNGELYLKLTITKTGRSVRIAAGHYVVEVDGELDGVNVVGGKVTLTRGEDEVVKIALVPADIHSHLDNASDEITAHHHHHQTAPKFPDLNVDVNDVTKGGGWELHKTIRGANENRKQVNGVWSVAFSPDAETLASATGEKTVKIWDVSTGKLQTKIQRPVAAANLAFSPDGKLLAIAGGDFDGPQSGEIVIWNLKEERVQHVLDGGDTATFCCAVAFSPDGKLLATGGRDKAVKLWDVQSGKLHRRMSGHSDLVRDVCFASDGKTLASASFDNTIRLWQLSTGEPIATLHGHDDAVRSVAFSPDDRVLVSASEDKTARVWNVASHEQIGVMAAHKAPVYCVAFLPDGQHVVTGSQKGMLVWDVSKIDQIPAHVDRPTREIWSVAVSRQMVAIPEDSKIVLWKRRDLGLDEKKLPDAYSNVPTTRLHRVREPQAAKTPNPVQPNPAYAPGRGYAQPYDPFAGGSSLPIPVNTLAGFVRHFNHRIQAADLDVPPQPPLTVEELRCFAQWKLQTDKQLSVETMGVLTDIGIGGWLPKHWKIEGSESQVKTGDGEIGVYSIELASQYSGTTIVVRQRFFSAPVNFHGPRRPDPIGTATPLQAAITEFNATHNEVDGLRQPPLTLQEVLAAILDWKSRRDEAPVDNKTFANFQEIALTHQLPSGAKIEVLPHFKTETGDSFKIWSVRVVMPQVAKPGSTMAFTIRQQYLSVNSAMASAIHWGKPNDQGLQAGFRLIPGQRAYQVGTPIETEFLYRSTTGKSISATVPNVFSYQNMIARDAGGKELDVVELRKEMVVGGAINTQIGETPIRKRGNPLDLGYITPDPKFDSISPNRTYLTVKDVQKVFLSYVVSDLNGGGLRTGEVAVDIAETLDEPNFPSIGDRKERTPDKFNVERDEDAAKMKSSPNAASYADAPTNTSSAIKPVAIAVDTPYCLVWESASKVSLHHEFANTLNLDGKTRTAVDSLLTEIWTEYIDDERDRTKYSLAADGHLVAEIGDLANDRSGLANEFLSKLGKIVPDTQRDRIWSAVKTRTDRGFDEIWKSDSEAYPALLGWSKDNSPIRIEIHRTAGGYHWYVRPGSHGVTGNGKTLPPELQHYVQFGNEATSQ
ncbi:Serine/threonine-protein kinase PknB [Rubripirellula tenax]|uniref:non-specific serine/threonine protein kinase n=1 Tax=Rubripirellula tenax TaxID=2528015 RepID=A0A5C6FC25_9BACT|nr:serine/threonine-protein kinase [Rubripirellula tenax]TWU58988.1 Serine/threonine-protein kinase PknB [Rubripirellula tenax]